MSIQVKIGRWRERGGGVAIVEHHCTYNSDYPWSGRDSDGYITEWQDNGLWLGTGELYEHDLIEYLGPLGDK